MLRVSLPDHDPEMKMMPIQWHSTYCLPFCPGLWPVLPAAFDLPVLFEDAPFDVKPFLRARNSRKLLESFSNTVSHPSTKVNLVSHWHLHPRPHQAPRRCEAACVIRMCSHPSLVPAPLHSSTRFRLRERWPSLFTLAMSQSPANMPLSLPTKNQRHQSRKEPVTKFSPARHMSSPMTHALPLLSTCVNS